MYKLLFLSILMLSCNNEMAYKQNLLKAKIERKNKEIYTYLNQESETERLNAVRCLGELQDSNSILIIEEKLKTEKSDLVYNAYLFALGQLGFLNNHNLNLKIEKFLIEQIEPNKDTQYQLYVDALSKVGYKNSIIKILEIAKKDTNPTLKKHVNLSLARLANRNQKNINVYTYLNESITSKNDDVRWSAAYAYMRISDTNTVKYILNYVKDSDPRVRMDIVRAIGNMKISKTNEFYKTTINTLIEVLHNDPDWRVRSNAASSLGNYKFDFEDIKKIYYLTALEKTKDKNEHVRISAIRSLAKSFSGDIKPNDIFLKDFFERYLTNTEKNMESAEIINALCLMFGNKLLENGEFIEYCKKANQIKNAYVRAKIFESLSNLTSPDLIVYYKTALNDSFLLVRYQVIEGLSKINNSEAKDLIFQSINTSDPTLLSIVAGKIAEDTVYRKDDSRKEALTKKIIEAFQSIQKSFDTEGKIGVIDALIQINHKSSYPFIKTFIKDPENKISTYAAEQFEKITGISYKDSLPKINSNTSLDYKKLDQIFVKKTKAKIHTSKGSIELVFHTSEAPISVLNFVELAEKKYFDGVYFHRVVPNFVIQTGDPTGTGWGGPGYSIVSEYNTLHYSRGVVGMASAGKDTEGSQWFITHSDQTHLDGRYSIFASVENGMEVVDQIQVGDHVKKIEILWDK